MSKRNVWGIHMRDIDGSLPIEKGFIAIGTSQNGDLSQFPIVLDLFRQRLAPQYPGIKPSAFNLKSLVLYRFTHSLRTGDIVVFPSRKDRTINIGIVSGDYQYQEEPIHKYHHSRQVEWKAHIDRDKFPQLALNALVSSTTLFRIKNHAEEFVKRLKLLGSQTNANAATGLIIKENPNEEYNGNDTPEYTSLESDTIDDETATHSTILKAAQTTEDFIIRQLKSHLTPYQFEEFVAHLLECMGYHARVTPETRDGGVDVIAHRDELGFEPPIIKVQCKQSKENSGEPKINQLLGTLEDGEYGLFVNLGAYSQPAIQKERNSAKLRLINGKDLVKLVLEHYPKLAPHYRTILPLKQIYVADVSGVE